MNFMLFNLFELHRTCHKCGSEYLLLSIWLSFIELAANLALKTLFFHIKSVWRGEFFILLGVLVLPKRANGQPESGQMG